MHPDQAETTTPADSAAAPASATKRRLKRSLTGRTRSIHSPDEDVGSATITASIPCGPTAAHHHTVKVIISGQDEAQHILSWHGCIQLPMFIDGEPATLQAGYCNLYKFPKIYFKHLRKGKGVVPEPAGLFVLEKLLLALLVDEKATPSGLSCEQLRAPCCCCMTETWPRTQLTPRRASFCSCGTPGRLRSSSTTRFASGKHQRLIAAGRRCVSRPT